MGRELPTPTTLFRKVYTNARKIRHSNQVSPQQFTRYVFHQIGRLEGMLVVKGAWYKSEVMQEFIDFQKRMENLLPNQD